MTDKKIDFKYTGIVLLAVGVTWLIHEFAHWVVSEALGYSTAMSLNGTRPVEGEYQKGSHQIVVSAAGPVFTILQAFAVYFWFSNKGWIKYLYPFLFTAFYMRTLAGLMNFINLNDEGRVSAFLGLGTFAIPLIVVGILFYLVDNVSRANDLDWKFHLINTLLVMIFSSALILADQFIGIRVI